MSDLYLGLDQGGSGSKGILVDESGKIHWQGTAGIKTEELPDGRIEQSPEEILQSLKKLIGLAKAECTGSTIKAAGLSIQRSGVLATTIDGKPLTPLLTWRDSRVKDKIEKIRSNADQIYKISGLPLTFNYAAAKIALLQKEFPNSRVRTLDSWLISQLTGTSDFLTEESHAARSQLYSIPERSWSKELCQIFEVDISRLPAIRESFSNFGTIDGIPLSSVLGDQQAALFGISGDAPIINIGTVAQVIVNIKDKPRLEDGYNCGVTFSSPSRGIGFQMEASINSSGATFDLLRARNIYQGGPENLDGVINKSEERQGIIFYPYVNPGSPDWRIDLPTLLQGEINGPSEFAAAMIENLGFWIGLNIQELKSRGVIHAAQSFIVALGGGSEVKSLIRVISAVSGVEVRTLENPQGSASGAAAGAFYSVNGAHLPSDSSKKFKATRVADEELVEKFRIWLELRTSALKNKITNYKKIDLGDLKVEY